MLQEIYERLLGAYGTQHWWPAETPGEVVIGAILTQNTAWANVERAIGDLRAARCLSWTAIRDLPQSRLEELIRSAGTYRVKAARLKVFADVMWKEHGGSLTSMLDGRLEDVRVRLLSIAGIGPETADAILLYAAGMASFVIDAYTMRVLRRHELIDADAGYDQAQALFHRDMRADPQVYNEYHALLVAVGKQHCRSKAQCAGCPLESFPHVVD